MDIIVGTAGHIDHGKTALVKALTGVNADRLPEEKKRGITIDLGFAELELGELRIGFVDVPGHEKFVKNMLAGASGIDLVALVIAADEGVMPQTREHFEICRLLETKRGVIVLTKIDLVDDEFLELVKLDVAELVGKSFLKDAPVVAVSSKTGKGIEKLKEVLKQTVSEISPRRNEIITRLPIDRKFSVRGFGAVVTGTLATGEIQTGSEMEVLPLQKKVRIRGVQTHGKDVEKANAGQRTAVNLGGINHDEIERGMILTEPDILRAIQIIDAEIEVLKDAKRPLRTRQRVRVHIGTIEALARIEVLNESREIKQGKKDLAQMRFESPVVAIPSERFILRQYSPQITIAGGKIIDVFAEKRKRKNLEKVRKHLKNLIEAESDKQKRIKLFLEMAFEKGFNFKDLQARTGWKTDVLTKALNTNIEKKAIIKTDSVYVARTPFDLLKQKILLEIEDHHKREPLSRGILRETLREKTAAHIPTEVFKTVLEYLEIEEKIEFEQDVVKSSSHSQELSDDEKQVRENLILIYKQAGLQVPTLEKALSDSISETKISAQQARKVFQTVVNSGEFLKVTEDYYFNSEDLAKLIKDVKFFVEEESEDRLIDVAKFKEIAGVSRKYAIPLLEYFDSTKITQRAGDKRIIL